MDKSDKDIHMNRMYIDKDGTKRYRNSKGSLHRLNGPAIEYSDGDKYWFKEGMLHRIDGPAIEWTNGDKSWFILSKELEEKDFNSWISQIKIFI